ncbi:phospholipid scramblase 1 [Lunasporangiospora selenospora]|uniref:Phospholipid scramblase 1 n=1 Tax=Lunasporangiospora selenospora TaxID=979761 RepID=A0A9P6KFL3_9FUNG|nr:phospholipid scramblase 1 [Lunasporangiospora selenospora]
MATLRKLQCYFLVFVTIYMLSGIAALVMGTLWLQQSAEGAPRDAVISRAIEKGGTFIGAIVAVTALVGYVGGIQPVERKPFLVAFAWLMVAAMIAELALGGVIWFKTLRMRSLFQSQWLTWPDTLKIAFQDMTSLTGYGLCCGYMDGQEIVSSGHCISPSTPFDGCEEKVSAFADSYLRKLYTSLFGFTVVNVVCLVSTIILVQARNDEERYRRIGRKEGRAYKGSI